LSEVGERSNEWHGCRSCERGERLPFRKNSACHAATSKLVSSTPPTIRGCDFTARSAEFAVEAVDPNTYEVRARIASHVRVSIHRFISIKKRSTYVWRYDEAARRSRMHLRHICRNVSHGTPADFHRTRRESHALPITVSRHKTSQGATKSHRMQRKRKCLRYGLVQRHLSDGLCVLCKSFTCSASESPRVNSCT
jgi:hypothetical protein